MLIIMFLIAVVGFGLYLKSTLYSVADTTYTVTTMDVRPIASPFPPPIGCANTTTVQNSGFPAAYSSTTLTCNAESTS